jgi:hypothetical protein
MTQAFAELLIDCEEDRTLRAVLLGMLRIALIPEESTNTSSSMSRGDLSWDRRPRPCTVEIHPQRSCPTRR